MNYKKKEELIKIKSFVPEPEPNSSIINVIKGKKKKKKKK